MTVATAAPFDAPTGATWTVVLAVGLTAVLEVPDSTIVNVALSHMKAAFGITDGQTVWILTSYIVASVAVMPLSGFFLRRFARRRLILTAIIGFMVFSALCGLSWSVGMIVYGVLDAGYLFIPRSLASGATMVITGAVLMNRVDARKLVFVELVLTGLGNLVLSWLNLDAGFWDIAWPGMIAGVGMGLFFVPMSTVAFQNLPAGTQD